MGSHWVRWLPSTTDSAWVDAMRLLIIEDYEPLRAALVQGFSEEGFAVDATGDGKEGLWYASGESYDAIILDLMLPNLDGLFLLRRIRTQGKRSPVIILTAKDAIPDRVLGLNEGADDYLVKPFAFEELLARVKVQVRRKYQVTSSVVGVGPLLIDLTARRVRYEGDEVQLTQLEYGILELLALRTGHVVSRTDISDHLYGFDAEPNSNAIDVHVAQLRRKLERPDRPKLIHTRRGMGYRLAMEA